ncbi:MAG: DUF1727 domain-containing protein [Eggerthellaceae bacterium]|nr:DUF1727 domain-containing protein [Eggerthellaceae bacterium]
MSANVQLGIAQAIGAASTWGLKHVFHRPAANFPGKAGLYADPHLIADLRPRISTGVVAVVGTNGKTTVTNLIADALEAAGKKVVCNRTGANLDSGVATALMHEKDAEWGVFECDELWLARIAPQLQPDYVLLLNLFRDQLDRVGEIALIQESIANALSACPETTLVYNADDPLCQAISERAGNASIPFGIAEDMGLSQNTVSDTGMCQRCDAQLDYTWRQYGQLGNYTCPQCGFSRSNPAYAASDIRATSEGTQLALRGGTVDLRLYESFSGTYMVYNVLAAYAATDLCEVPFAAFEHAVHEFDPQNGRLQRYEIDGTDVLLNLAKNPTGFNQNLKIVMSDHGPKAVAFYINDKEADGHDVSWLWDVDFQELADADGLVAFAGGIRRNDMQVRLKHAGIEAQLVEGARDFLEKARTASPDATCYLIANYTALPAVKAELDELNETGGALGSARFAGASEPAFGGGLDESRPYEGFSTSNAKLKIVHLYPTLLNLYGDGGNVTVLANRARWRGMDAEVERVDLGQDIDLSNADIVFLGGGPDREQRIASRELLAQAGALRNYVEDDGVLLAICGGYQILGREWIMDGQSVPGLGIIGVVTKRADGNAHNRLVGNIALQSALANTPVIGYENHAGRTYLDATCKPFGQVAGRHGHGNNDSDGADGVLYRNVVGTYLHGPLLAKNPEIADYLIERALERQAAKTGTTAPPLPPLDDTIEREANAFMRGKLGLRLE